MRNAIALLALTVLIGCATFNDNAGKVLATAAQTVDAGMKSWAIYVATKNISNQDQIPVKRAYMQYQTAMAAAESAYISLVKTGDRTAWATARDALIASQSNLIKVVESFTQKTP